MGKMENNLEFNETVTEKPENLANDKTQSSQTTATTQKSDRIGRRRFFVWSCHFLPMFILLSLASCASLDGIEMAQVTGPGCTTDGEIECTVFLNSLFVVATLFYIWAAIKRLHDMNMSGWWSVLYFLQGQVLFFLVCLSSEHRDFHWYELPGIFFVSLYFWYLFPFFNIAMCCTNGTRGTNKYGVEPN